MAPFSASPLSTLRRFSTKPSVRILDSSTKPKPLSAHDHHASKASLIYKGPITSFIFKGRLFSFFWLASNAIAAPLLYPMMVLPPKVLAVMFSTTASLPTLAVGLVSRGYVTRIWMPPASKSTTLENQSLMLETQSFFLGTPCERIVKVSELRYRPKWVFGTWRVVGDAWWKPGFAMDIPTLEDDPVLKRINEQIKSQK
ncbi:hypothetical protein HDU98_006402 [Podochytrium sp. JEL0797]|nr:hypothetical protein HDU98_006402 [Podochytrium sp. JEL0797]